ncbi:AmpG family muropeptide MFS transporter [Alkalinema pantanalense CENA528]|uniref:AmpG family muropeptide MFS transporter n=1 Tax=Alkalinema pantanalense TaxID=1620705 RepID=UPI003D6DB594
MSSVESSNRFTHIRKMGVLSLLGFAGGLPFLLTGTGRALQAWLTTNGVSATVIGLFGLAALPYSLKVFWAPLLDRYIPPLLGRRRGWLLLSQIALVVGIVILGSQNPSQLAQFSVNSSNTCAETSFPGLCEFWQALMTILPSPFFQLALLVAFLSATQDISADAYRTDVLKVSEMGSGAAFFVTGYRIALVIAGGVALAIADPKNPQHWSWQQVYWLVAGLMSLGIVATLLAPEPKQFAKPTSMQAAIVQPFQEFFRRMGWQSAVAALGFVVLYRYGDALLNVMAVPFLLNAGYQQGEIGVIQGILGILATIAGTICGGAVFSKIGVNKSLWVFGILQAASNLAYWLLATFGKSGVLVSIPTLTNGVQVGVGQTDAGLLVAIVVENFCGGLGTAGFLGFMMTLCNPQFSATQFALLSSLMAVSRDILASPAGAWAKDLGWSNFFLMTMVAALPGLLLLPIFAPWRGTVPEPRDES